MIDSRDIQSKLNLLRHSFVARTGPELDDLVVRLSTDSLSQTVIQEAYQLLHRLSGSAGTFGFTELGTQAKALEARIKTLAEPTEGDTPGPGLEQSQTIDDTFLDQLKELSRLLTVTPASSARSPVTGEEPSHFSQTTPNQHIVFVGTNDDLKAGLLAGLTPYGYSVYSLSTAEDCASWFSGPPQMGQVAFVVDEAMAMTLTLMRDSADTQSTCRPPIIALSHNDAFTTRYQLAELGCDGFFPLPVDTPALADHIERLLAEQQEINSGRVLLVDDDRNLSEHYQTVLEAAGLSVRVINHPPDIVSALAEFRPDILLLDWYMGNHSGVTLARLIRFQPEWLGLPIIYLSSEQDTQQQLSAMANGGDEFLTKPIADDHLIGAVKIRCFRAKQLSKLLYRDSLTGLLKHAFIKQEIAKEHSRQKRLKLESVVAMLDLDHFKRVNDDYGHATGDIVIKSVANLLRHRLRSTDAIGRYGGEEFAIVLPECTPETAKRMFEEICQNFSSIPFTSGDRHSTSL